MGLAIIVPDVDFSSANLGKVTLKEQDKPLISISISGPSSVEGSASAETFSVNYNPSVTSQRGVTWSIVSGSQYASIDNNGNLSILRGASNSPVTIKATSTVNGSITAVKDISVTYKSSGNVKTYVDFIRTNNGASIDTGVILSENSIVDVSFLAVSEPTDKSNIFIVEDRNGTKRGSLIGTNGYQNDRLKTVAGFGVKDTSSVQGGSYYNYAIGVTSAFQFYGIKYDMVLKAGSFTANGVSLQGANVDGIFYPSPYPVRLLKNTADAEINIFGLKIYDGEQLVRNMRPCILNESIIGDETWDGQVHNAGESGMWDDVEGKFYGNITEGANFEAVV